MPALLKGKQVAADTITGTNIEETGAVSTVNAGDSAVGGTSTGIARRDHQHAVDTGAATSTIQPDDAAAEGSSSKLAREDHQHAIVAAAPSTGIGAGNSEGSATSFARSDHDHKLKESGAADLTLGAIADAQLVQRSGTTLAGTTAINDTQHGSRGGATLHSAVTTGTNGFMSAADKTKLDALQNAAGIDAKESCLCRTQADHALTGLTAIDGVTPGVGDRILVDSQTTAAQDGIYIAAAAAWARSTDAPIGAEARGWIVHIEEGTVDHDTLWQCTNNEAADIINTHGLTFARIGQGAPRGAGAGLVLNGNDLDVNVDDTTLKVDTDVLKVKEIGDTEHGNRGGGALHADVIAGGADGFMTGADKTKLNGIDTGAQTRLYPYQESITTEAITGTDTALTDLLEHTPVSDLSVSLYLNGIQQQQGAGKDYTISSKTLTWLASTGIAVDMEITDTLETEYMCTTLIG